MLRETFGRFGLYQEKSGLIQLAVISSVLGLSAAASTVDSLAVRLLAIGLILGGLVGLLLLRCPPLGLLLLIGSIVVPFSGPSHSNLTLAVAALLIGLWLLELLIRRQPLALLSPLAVKFLLGLVVVATLALITGQLAWYRAASPAPLGAQVAGLALFYLSAGLFLVVAHQVRDVRWLQWIVGLFLLLGALNVLGWLLPGIVGRLTGRLFSSGATGSLFWTWLLILAFTQALFNTELRPPLRLAAGGLAVATTYVILTEFWTWNSGWMPPLAAVFTILFFAFPRLGVLMTVAATVPVLIKIQAVIASLMVGDNQYSYETRLEAWAIVWELAQANPILGLGPANYYWYTPLIPIRGYSVQFNSHQQYVDLIAQTGILGLICFVGFFAAMGWLAWRLRPQMPPGFARAYTYAVLGGVGGTFVAGALGDWVIPFFYNINLGGFRASMLSWLFLGGLLALQQIYQVSTRAPFEPTKESIHG